MNPSLEKNIAELQLNKRSREATKQPSGEDLAVLETLVKQIQSIKLGNKTDKYGDRCAWLKCVDKTALLDDLSPSNGQREFLESETLTARVMSTLEDGPTARRLDLFTIDPGINYPSGHLLGMLALGPEDTRDWTYEIFSTGEALIIPGSAEFNDVQSILNNFGSDVIYDRLEELQILL